ncbi:MAG: NAD-dependent DNA ligase LigA [Candidatus Portnoybacteria bacterium CG10_big_fil_rev_8_21_14_0_10_36_7]|uniref:DNA ligase n=1 Tax=Candidatus Portnoybacteria bacterium CG10_big_fil_rev_8_21_14_0_10_36_7 TaxID=1974812 RepID=A0A2M8KDM6_9BACT|nr:MAG: NAD-dependent DNA ligase LigA [Candidatus Portnoybacteria bacterium CG10_big_fil_rev_8_21_14_0_10_36_7]
MTKNKAQNRIDKLKEVINHHRYLYHVLDTAEISDFALDSLKHELSNLEQQFPEFITSDSPSQRVGGEPLAKFKKINHKVPMLSLNDVFDEAEVTDWYSRMEKLSPTDKFDFFCEYKMDGFAVSLIYKQGIFIKGATRGDGKVGEDVTQNLKTIESVPLKLQLSKKLNAINMIDLEQEIEVRGEIYMEKKDFENINKERNKKNEPIYANPRNTAAGSIRQLDPAVAGSRNLKFMAYAITSELGLQTHEQEHELLRSLGFKSDVGELAKNILEVISVWKKIDEYREKLPFEIDGVVINVNSRTLFKKLGIIGKAPRASVAFKFRGKEATTKVLDIVPQVGRTGALTPVAILNPVKVGGVTISRASLHNHDEIDRLDVRIGDTVIVQRAGDVIPDIVKSFPNLRTGYEKKFHMPAHCPVCSSKVVRKDWEVSHRCSNKNCGAILRERIYHFVSKKAFNIVGLGPQKIDALLDEGLIKDASDIFELTEGDVTPLERFAEKSVSNLIKSIESAKKISLAKFIYALGIVHVGEETAIDLAKSFENIKKLQSASQDDLISVKDIGPVAAQSVANWFGEKKNKNFIDRVINLGVVVEEESPRKENNKFKGKTFVFTGELEAITRDNAKAKVRDAGAEVSGSVSNKTDYVIAGKNAGSKYSLAKKLGIKILNENEFLKLIK